ncbi:related to KRE6-glucan synthase subunit [Armillaria ostoyae]|uniref:Related to KRE6-glucan synthase subunit n=1 Tax=Armillaria ostoyae TaxID=47428 RepID=A0A284RF85_ARMOS|nr:related to KRE6-glucan synthase subunit [Armillaria ostoyae]
MAQNSARRAPPTSPQEYAAVPQSPRTGMPTASPSSPGPRPPASTSSVQQGRGSIAQGVASGAIGAGYGPYSYNPLNRDAGLYNGSRFSAAPSEVSSLTGSNGEKAFSSNTSTVPQYLWDKDPDLDDALHSPDPVRDAKMDRSFTLFSARGWLNAGALVILVVGLMTLFAGYPIIVFYAKDTVTTSGFNLGGINGSGQIPDLPGLPSLIDSDTPSDAYTRTGQDGKKYNLVFSDEFNTDGRTFYPGDDPYWEAADLHYWPTGDLEWYDPSGAITENGKLVLTITMEDIHDLNFKSGMITSWNKFCFMTGYVEVSVSMPGSSTVPGFWPGAWTMGNLGRAGYGATTEGMWPYSYDSCDVGTFPNQTSADGEPAAALTGSTYGGTLSFLPGQRVSACTCSGGDHPGPSVNVGRGVPEIDILEHQIETSIPQGEVSQSFQIAPFSYQYSFGNTTPDTIVTDPSITTFNSYKGGTYQQAVSALTLIDPTHYNDVAYGTYGFEWWSDPDNRDDGYIQWYSGGTESWQVTSAAIGPDSTVEVGQRLIPEEPMYLILNLGLSPSFQPADYKHLQFPAKMYIDYVRVYQRAGTKGAVTCNPSTRPTQDYINNHIEAYTNANWTTWSAAGFDFPLNSKYHGC